MICHLDMDCFYASVEMKQRPELAAKPLAVGGGGPRGVVTTCNYVARAKGIRSAMPGFMARQRCPELIFLPVRFAVYQEESRQVFEYLESRARQVEKSSVDEGYFEAPEDARAAWDFCAEIRAGIFERFGLTCSIGIAPNKMLAKIMSGYRKPDAQLLLRLGQVEAFMKTLDVRKIPGVGPKAEKRFHAEGIRTCADLQAFSAEELAARHGHWGLQLYDRCRGFDERKITPCRERKSVSAERTLSENVHDENSLLKHLRNVFDTFRRRLGSKLSDDLGIEKVFVRFKFADFRKTSHECLSSKADYEIFEKLALETFRRDPGEIRLIGLGIRLDVPQKKLQDPRQLSFWDMRGLVAY